MTGTADGRAAVVFDFYGTLTPVNPAGAWIDHTSRLAALLGVEPEALARALDESYPERATGALGDVRRTLRTLATRLGAQLTEDRLDKACQLRQAIQESLFRLRPEALPVIGQLRSRGLRIGLVSDCTSELPTAWPRLSLAPVVDAPVFSCVEGTRKPDPRLFRAVTERLAVADIQACARCCWRARTGTTTGSTTRNATGTGSGSARSKSYSGRTGAGFLSLSG